ncbi:hypothetical protein D3227_24000 [Mesorhizobium waimense]|uniref:Uncharacterized protein n=1 Tax=Mesorhizobium waimense TaxID=1300307 RepID=A0A3A5KMP1_9HYPH|nr:hypothetical protein [Mesorhizobium waimense]RJT34068.1 hypothetical protein D3227_24000 [Mesorhizobium waimense]
MTPYSAEIERVEQHIREIEQRLARQLEVVAHAEETGQSIDSARTFLLFLKQTLGLSRDHLARLLADEAMVTRWPSQSSEPPTE